MSIQVNRKKLLQWGITFLVPILLFFIPCTEVFTHGIKMFCIVTAFAVLMLCFELADVMVSAMFLMLGYYVTGAATWELAFGGFTNTNVYIILGVFLLVSVMEKTGALKRMAYLIMSGFGGSYLSLLIGLFITCLVLCFVTFGTSGFIIGAISYGICRTINADKKTAAGIGLVSCIVSLGGRCFLLSPMYLAPLMGAADDRMGYTVMQYLPFLVQMWPYLIVLIIMTLLIAKMYKSDQPIASRAFFKEEYKKLGAPSKDEKKVYALLVVLFIYFFGAPRLFGLNANMGFIILPWLCFLPGIDLANASNIKDIKFNTVFFVVACFGIGNVATSLGIGEIVANLILPYAAQLGTTGTGIIIYVLCALLNFAMTPYAIEGTVTLPFTEIVLGMGLDPTFAYNLMAIGMDQLLFPYEYADYLVVYSFGMMSMSDFIKMNGIKMVIATIFVVAILLPYWHLISFI